MPIYPIGIVVIFANLFTTHTIMDCTISLMTEMPESLHSALKGYLDSHPDWDQDRAITAALSLFLMQNNNDRTVARTYLDTLFGEVA